MGKRFYLLIVFIISVAIFSACNSEQNVASTLPSSSAPVLQTEEAHNRAEVTEETVTSEEAQDANGNTSFKKIPVYTEEKLLFETNGMYYLNRDASFYYGLSSLPNDASAILAAYPTAALRVRSDQSSYAVYDTDQGNRFFLFFNDGEISTTIGFPIVINKLLSYSDFEDIAVGDTIDAVAAIDNVAELYKKTFFEVWQLDYAGAKSLSEIGHPCVTVHYLKDGILKIEYEMLEDQSLVVSKVIFNEDFKIENARGEMVNHKIEDIDLPVSVYAIETVQKKQPHQVDNTVRANFRSVIEENKETNSKTKLKNIPVYMEEELLFKTNGLFYLNRDACFYEGLNDLPNLTGSLLEAYPTSAIRSRDSETIYFVYRTDTGYRLYLFASYENNLHTPVGFPVVIGTLLSYDDFKSIRIGDNIEKVEAVDSVATLHKKLILDVWNLAPMGAQAHAENGYPCTTIHYLKEGILKIEYEMQHDQRLVVSNIVFSKDFQIRSANGQMVNYKIEDIDLPAEISNEHEVEYPLLSFYSVEECNEFLNGKAETKTFVTYNMIEKIGTFDSITFLSNALLDDYSHYMYRLYDASGYMLYLYVKEGNVQTESRNELIEAQIDPQNLRKLKDKSDGTYICNGYKYQYVNGELLSINWETEAFSFVLSGDSMLSDYPENEKTILGSLLSVDTSSATKTILHGILPE